MEKIVKECLIHLLEGEERRQNFIHKGLNKNCEYCKELKRLIEEVKQDGK